MKKQKVNINSFKKQKLQIKLGGKIVVSQIVNMINMSVEKGYHAIRIDPGIPVGVVPDGHQKIVIETEA